MTSSIISQIQHRRGIKSDLPQQLAEGEFGFCLDTRQLFIGNSDGFQDNTEIVTQYSQDILGNINVLATGTTFARNLKNRFADVTNVKDFGAKGDGISDDTAAVQAAVNAKSPYNLVYFPTGTYKIQSVNLPNGIRMVGNGRGATQISAIANNSVMFNYMVGASTGYSLGISDMQFDPGVTSNSTAIKINGSNSAVRVQDINLENLNIFGKFAQGIYLKNCANSSLNNIFISQSYTGITLEVCADTDLMNIKIQNGAGVGFNIVGDNLNASGFDEGVRLTNCSSNVQDIGLKVQNQQWGIATNCSFTSCANGSLIMNNVSTWKFANVEFANGTYQVPNVQTDQFCSTVTWTGCNFVIGKIGAWLKGNSYSITNSIFTANLDQDLYLECRKSTFSNNLFESSGNVISVLETGVADLNVLTANTANGNIFIIGGTRSIQANNISRILY